MNNIKKKIVVRIAEGLGNQLFMYANAYALSQTYNYELLIDNTSGYFQTKNKIRNYELDNFLISSSIADKNLKFDSSTKNLIRKFMKRIDLLRKFKKFIIESKDSNKNTYFNKIDLHGNTNIFFVEGHFECEKYFIDFKSDIKKIFKIKNDLIDTNSQYINELRNCNSVSICIRQNRYSERKNKNESKSVKFTKDTIDYVYKSIDYIKKKVDHPRFFVWSNDSKNLSEYFSTNDFVFIDNKKNKSLNDFNLFKYCKHFIVGPTSFHWWGAWLNDNPNKICVRPKDINPSNNKNFWPEEWISI